MSEINIDQEKLDAAQAEESSVFSDAVEQFKLQHLNNRVVQLRAVVTAQTAEVERLTELVKSLGGDPAPQEVVEEAPETESEEVVEGEVVTEPEN